MTNRDHFMESASELPTPLSVLYSVVDDARRYKDYLKDNAQGIYDQEPADFLGELRDETSTRGKRAEDLLAQRLADGGVHQCFSGKSMSNFPANPFYEFR